MLIPYGPIEFCTSDRWSFVGFILPTLKAYVVCIAEGTMNMVIIVNTSIDVNLCHSRYIAFLLLCYTLRKKGIIQF